jgi:hypothetical protein
MYLFNSCNSLDLAPEDYYAGGNFWRNSAQVSGNMLGLHNDLRSKYQGLYILGEARGGTQVLYVGATGQSITFSTPIKDNAFTKDNVGISNWYDYYPCIMRVNHFITEVESGCKFLSQQERGYFLGQAYGIRAYYYFMLYRTYGGVPVIEKAKIMEGISDAEELYTLRSTPKQTFDFIKSDILKSEELFASDFLSTSNGLWSKAATLMLKAEIYLWSAKVSDGDQSPASSDLQTSKDALSQLIGKFNLLPKFTDVFEYSGKQNNETIFAIRFLEGEATNFAFDFTYNIIAGFVNTVYSKEGTLMGDTLRIMAGGQNFNAYKFELFESYDVADSRKEATFLDFYLHNAAGDIIDKGLVLRKFIGIINATGNRLFVTDIPVFRYAETLLMMAEVENKLGNDPSPYINEVRKRAYGANYDPAIHAYITSDFAANEMAILHERDKEFVFEGKRWFYIRRMQDASGKPLVFSPAANYGSNQAVLDPVADVHKVLWPVDANTLNNDPTVEQTPGY